MRRYSLLEKLRNDKLRFSPNAKGQRRLPIVMIIGSFFCMVLIIVLTQHDLDNPTYYQLNQNTLQTEAFRSLNMQPEALSLLLEAEIPKNSGLDCYDLIALSMVHHHFNLQAVKEKGKNRLDLFYYQLLYQDITRVKPVEYGKLKLAYQNVFEAMEVFPIPRNICEPKKDIQMSSSNWKEKDYFDSETGRNGIKLYGKEEVLPGYYPVLSCGRGTVTDMGWSDLYGNYIVVTTEAGVSLYYGHLHSYVTGLKQCDKVMAGQMLGFMGDTGYGEGYGTSGNIAPALYLELYFSENVQGEYVKTTLNPYYILEYLYQYRRTDGVY